jgi:hypothetical protein
MDILGWLGWALVTVLGLVWWLLGFLWAVVWFLISGWVSTLLQVTLLIAAIFFLKYGWQRAPAELWRRGSTVARFSWNWLRAREPQAASREVREVVRVVRVKEVGDVNISTLLSLLMLLGLVLLGTLR